MNAIAIGFWGAFFGTATLMLIGALGAFAQSYRRVALLAALSALVSALYALAYLGWLPGGNAGRDARVLTNIGVLAAVILTLMLLTDLGVMRRTRWRRLIFATAVLVAIVAFALSWRLTPAQGVTYGTVVPLACSIAGLLAALLSARRGDRIAWVGVFALAWLTVGLTGAYWIAHDRQGTHWIVHAVTASAGVAYLAGIGGMLWLRYSYLIELREVLAHGPRYDPVTRMPSEAATGHMIAQALRRHPRAAAPPIGLLAVSIGNLAALEQLHGRATLNHVLFVCASRLRRCVPAGLEMGRLFEDGFLLVAAHGRDVPSLVRLGRVIAASLSRPIRLRNEHGAPAEGEAQAAWVAQVGVGVLAATAPAEPAAVAREVRELSRSASSVAGRVAWREHAGDAGAPLTVLEPA